MARDVTCDVTWEQPAGEAVNGGAARCAADGVDDLPVLPAARAGWRFCDLCDEQGGVGISAQRFGGADFDWSGVAFHRGVV